MNGLPVRTLPLLRPGVTFCLCVLLPFIAANATTHYVSMRGSDVNSGAGPGKAFRTIGRAVRSAAAGDTVFVLSGTYREIISLNGKNSLPDRPLCIMGYEEDSEAYPVIDGGAPVPSSRATNYWMTITNSSWVEVARLTFKNGWTSPIRIDSSSYLSFRNCRFYGGKRVIEAHGSPTHHILVERCFWDQGGEYLWRLKEDSLGIDGWTAMHHGSHAYFNGSLIDFRGTGGSVVVRQNRIVNAFNGIRYRGQKGHDTNVEIYDNDISCIRDNDFEPEYYTYNVYIYHNRSHNIHRTLSIDNVEGGNIFYFGNVITTDPDPWTREICSGFWKIYGPQRALQYPVYAFNNSFYGTGEAFSSEYGVAKLLKHFNNAYCFDGRGWALYQWDSTSEFDYDISNEPWSPRLIDNGQEQHGRIGNIRFIDPGARDLRLQAASPGLDAGKIVEVRELGWKQEFVGRGTDVGAYEDGRLVEGPAFRFMAPPDGSIGYQERPRIVRHRIRGNAVLLDFSDAIDTSTVDKAALILSKGGQLIPVVSLSFPNAYSVVLKTDSIPGTGELTLGWKTLPRGLNGESLTYWGSTLQYLVIKKIER